MLVPASESGRYVKNSWVRVGSSVWYRLSCSTNGSDLEDPAAAVFAAPGRLRAHGLVLIGK